MKYAPDWFVRTTLPLDSVYCYNDIIVANAPQLGFIFVYRHVWLEFIRSSSPVKYYNDATILTVRVPNRDVFWFRSRGNKNYIGTGGKAKAWCCKFPLRNELQECRSENELKKLFELREFTFTGGIYRAVVPIDETRIVACGIKHESCAVIVTGNYRVINTEFAMAIDDCFWTPAQQAYIMGQSEMSWHPGNGVTLAKQ